MFYKYFHFSGMKILQFGFTDGPDSQNEYRPYAYPEQSVAYTGTHDCDTLVGFFTSLSQGTRAAIAARLDEAASADPLALARAAMRHLLRSPARRVIFQAQDLLLLGSAARMNTPGTTAGNWGWRLSPADVESLKNLAPLWG